MSLFNDISITFGTANTAPNYDFTWISSGGFLTYVPAGTNTIDSGGPGWIFSLIIDINNLTQVTVNSFKLEGETQTTNVEYKNGKGYVNFVVHRDTLINKIVNSSKGTKQFLPIAFEFQGSAVTAGPIGTSLTGDFIISFDNTDPDYPFQYLIR